MFITDHIQSDLSEQTIISCGPDCYESLSKCNRDPMPSSCAPWSAVPTQQPVSSPSPTFDDCPLPRPSPVFHCESEQRWVSHGPVNVDSLYISGRVEVYGPVSARHLNFYFSAGQAHNPSLMINSCWYHAAPEILVHFTSGMDVTTLESRLFTLVEIESTQHTCPAIANWQITTTPLAKSSCTTVEAKASDPGRATDLNKFQVVFSLKKCKTWLWILLGTLIPSILIISVTITILRKPRYKARFCPCLTRISGPYELIQEEESPKHF
jgi:hypothetical protein